MYKTLPAPSGSPQDCTVWIEESWRPWNLKWDKTFCFPYPIVWALFSSLPRSLPPSRWIYAGDLEFHHDGFLAKFSKKQTATISLHNFWCSLLDIFSSLSKKCGSPGRFWRVREECFSCSQLWKGPQKTWGLVTFSCSPSAALPGVLDKWCSWRKSLARKGKHFSTNIHFN